LKRAHHSSFGRLGEGRRGLIAVVATVIAAGACGGESRGVVTQSGPSNGGGDQAPSAGAGGSGCSGDCCVIDPTANVTVVPSDSGWVDRDDACNSLRIQGAWHVYGDQYDSPETRARCITVGSHLPSECALVTAPVPPPALGFPNLNGALTTAGTTEEILGCPAGSEALALGMIGCPSVDFANMIGAGIAFDFNADAPPPSGVARPWDPAAFDVIGVSFVIDKPPATLRIEFPILLTDAEAAGDSPPITVANPTSDDYSLGSPYWGAMALGDARLPASPVVAGLNVVTWDQVAPPSSGIYVFDTTRLVGVRFHVPASGAPTPYEFTVKNFTFLRHL